MLQFWMGATMWSWQICQKQETMERCQGMFTGTWCAGLWKMFAYQSPWSWRQLAWIPNPWKRRKSWPAFFCPTSCLHSWLHWKISMKCSPLEKVEQFWCGVERSKDPRLDTLVQGVRNGKRCASLCGSMGMVSNMLWRILWCVGHGVLSWPAFPHLKPSSS